ncbi:DUF6314 family protein [Rhodovulum sp. DZ06]|uniref:DUF6314 family protein n=1 Tax=Rhodovulum sp. DZ06 TaxID=3425126 RepID=UPI003D335E91
MLGRWRLTRRIEDFHAAQEGAFHGEAELRHEPGAPDRLAWEEEGLLRLGKAEARGRRAYLWRLQPPDVVEISHADGRFFHLLRVKGDGDAVSHDCPPDLYKGEYRFETPDRWTLEWRVTGPRKDYRMLTVHERIG